ncbi:Serine/threonine-protein kinase hal4 (Fragment) [Madurella fahalii]|uniref:Serine/threonine-protein kinase hal4 n=1 Tax=Madurella fahalii TaxID=1157608 RepID=A0ABQ0G2G9_9PEZI
MALSVLAAAATQTSSLGIFTLLDLSHELLPLPPPSPSSSTASNQTVDSTFSAPDTASHSSSAKSSLSSSPRQYPTDLTHPILEEGDETDSEALNEPVTPVSGRQSQDFQALANQDVHLDAAQDQLAAPFPTARPGATAVSKPPLVVDTTATPPLQTPRSPPPTTSASQAVPSTPTPPTPSADQDPRTAPPSRRSTFSSTSSFKRTMSSFLRRVGSQADKPAPGDSSNSAIASSLNLPEGAHRKIPARRWSMNRSSATTRSNSPPSPSSPLEMAVGTREEASKPMVPGSDAFKKKKTRTSTGFSLRSRPAVANGSNGGPSRQELQLRRRASSFDYTKQEEAVAGDAENAIHMERSLWGLPAETGTGVKARRMSLSLPDDFTVDVAELSAEFEYQHKLLGRHGKHLGKGATSKVTLMVSKNGGELYAVKEFRGKSSSETKEEYEKKIKSEYTLAKSLHHPNIVDTIRLCIDRGRWNHVMEYCEDGDLFTLVNKKYLKAEDREKDRLCLFKQLVNGIHYLHSNGIAHRDIKLENLLITKECRLKITDFGVSEVFSGIHPGLREAGGQCGKNMVDVRRCAPGICGSMPYISPEVLKKSGDYDPRGLDVWSSAIVMVNLIFGGPLWHKAEVSKENGSGQDTYAKLVRGWEKWTEKHAGSDDMAITDMDYPHVWVFDNFVKPPALRRVLLQMLNPDPEKRISIANVVNNRWVKNIECCQSDSFDEPNAATMIDASKKACQTRVSGKKIFCHNHLPPKELGSHSLGKMPGSAGY